MAEKTQEEKDKAEKEAVEKEAKATARQEFRMQLDQVLSDLKSQINVEVSNKIREGMSKETNIDNSQNVEINVGAPAPAAEPEPKPASKPPSRR